MIRPGFVILMIAASLVVPCPPVVSAQEQDAGAGTAGAEAAMPVPEESPESSIVLGADVPGLPAAPSGASGGLILRMLLILILAAAAIYGVVYFLKRASRPQERRDPNVKLLSTVHLGGNRFVHAVAVGGKVWLLGAGDAGVNLIAEIEDQDAVNAMLLEESRRSAEAGSGRFPDFRSLIRRLGLPVDNGIPGPDRIRKNRERLKGFK
ncbi:MAG: flagellar biosynthetic protein FliO [Treponema sp.]|nr:flagellar biosynthetic protein FliO [Treponema sp.]